MVRVICRTILVGMILQLFGLHSSFAESSPLARDEVLMFSAGFYVNGTKSQNVLHLGYVEPCQSGWCLKLLRYEGIRRLPRARVGGKHQMVAPYRVKACDDEQLTTVFGEVINSVSGVLVEDSAGIFFSGGGFKYKWLKGNGERDAYRLEAIRDEDVLASGGRIEQIVGYAYVSNRGFGNLLDRSIILGKYRGEINHKDANAKLGDQWRVMQSSIDFDRYSLDAISIGILHLSHPTTPEIRRQLKRDIWVAQSISLWFDIDLLAPLNHEYGHDFNANGCFDEFGHNKMLFPVIRDGYVTAFVYVEYTPYKIDADPMVSVGHYFR